MPDEKYMKALKAWRPKDWQDLLPKWRLTEEDKKKYCQPKKFPQEQIDVSIEKIDDE